MKKSRSSCLFGKQIVALAVVALAALLAAGCVSTFKEVKPLASGAPPKQRPSALALGELQITDARLSEPEKKVMAHAFQLGVEKWCAEHKSFDVLRDVPSTNVPPGAIILKGAITQVEKGSAAARFWVGMGAGQQRAVGEFMIHSSDGTKLTSFTARKSYLGGSGIGGWDMMKLEDLIDKLGQLVAETTDKWVRGERIE
ncbi:MAG TPA: DUF4410 domain-containing protein [Verrucomicrobiae bacterium]|nr:DUF4410 domain-containing protein [Verrucomicrobiae bacterium]